MPTEAELRVLLSVRDQATAAVQAFGKQVDALSGEVDRLSAASQQVAPSLRQGFSLGAGIAAFQGVLGLIAQGFNLIADSVFTQNSALEQSVATFEAFTRSASRADQIVRELRKEADITPFNTAEMITAGKSLISVSQSASIELMDLVKTAEVLAALDPFQGLVGAAFALREAVAGDFSSIVGRFELSREAINRFAAQGMSGLKAVQAVLAEMGASSDLVERLGRTFEGRRSTIASFFDEIRRRLGERTFEIISEQMGRFVEFINRASGQIYEIASNIGNAIGGLVTAIGGEFQKLGVHLLNVFQAGLGDQVLATFTAVPPQARQTAESINQVTASLGRLAQVAQLADVQASLDQTAQAAQRYREALAAGGQPEAADRVLATVERMRGLLVQTEMPLLQLERQTAALGIEVMQVNRNATQLRNSFDDAVYPLERMLTNIRLSKDLALELRAAELDLEAVGLRLDNIQQRRAQFALDEVNARLRQVTNTKDLVILDAQLERLRARAAGLNPDDASLPIRQRVLALTLREMELRRQGLALEGDIADAAQSPQAIRLREIDFERQTLSLLQQQEQIRSNMLSLPIQRQIDEIRAAQEAALRPVELQLRALQQQNDELNEQRARWNLLKLDIQIVQKQIEQLPKVLPLATPEQDAEFEKQREKFREQGEKIWVDLSTSFDTWMKKGGGTVWGGIAVSINDWWSKGGGKEAFSQIATDIGTFIGTGIAEAVYKALPDWLEAILRSKGTPLPVTTGGVTGQPLPGPTPQPTTAAGQPVPPPPTPTPAPPAPPVQMPTAAEIVNAVQGQITPTPTPTPPAITVEAGAVQVTAQALPTPGIEARFAEGLRQFAEDFVATEMATPTGPMVPTRE